VIQGASGAGSDVTRALLLDRLVDVDPVAVPDRASGRTISRAELEESVAREIRALFGTRIDPAVDAIEPRDRTVLEYGLPDFTALAAQSGSDLDRLARAAERAILAFEPRLARPRVEVAAARTTRDVAVFFISGVLTWNGVPESATFPVDLRDTRDERIDAG
jgi:type VI secretion system lysozyme-like protein